MSTTTSSAPTAESNLRVGVVGCGAIGQRRHIPEAHANPHAALVALCDVRPGRAEDVAKRFGNPTAYTDLARMLATEKLDLLVIGTPNARHAEQAIAGLNAGCHVLVEKPMAANEEQARAMIAAAEKAGKLLMVGQNQRLMPAHVKAKKILDGGTLGRPINFQTTFKHGGPDGWSVDGAASWFFKKPEAVMGVCGDLGVHKIDLMQYLLGQRITEVSGFIGTLSKTETGTATPISVDDTAFLSVKTSGGVIGSITITWTHYGNFEDNGTTIFCENGVLQIGETPEFGVVVHNRDGTKEYYKTGATSTNAKQVSSGMIDSFIASILAGRPPLIDGKEGLSALRVILAAFEAAKTGKTQTIDHAV